MILNAEQQQRVDTVMREAIEVSTPEWHHYSIFKQQLEQAEIYDTAILRQLTDILEL